MPVIECPDEPSQFEAFRTTLAPILQARGDYPSNPLQLNQQQFVDRLRRVFAEVLPEPPALGFKYLAALNDAGERVVTLTWEKDADAVFTASGKSEDLAFLSAAAKAYAHPHFRKLLDQAHTPQNEIAANDRRAPLTASHHMIDRSLKFDPQGSRHSP